MNYRVTWTIDVEAASPLEAARKAQEIQRDPESIATIFDIIPFTHDAEGRITRFNEVSVDLMGE